MAKSKFWRTTKFVFVSIFQITWLIIIFNFYILPRFIISLPIKRAILRGKMKRYMIKNGMPREEAKILAWQYNKNLLVQYGTIRGLIAFIKEGKKLEDQIKNEKEDEGENIKEKKSFPNQKLLTQPMINSL